MKDNHDGKRVASLRKHIKKPLIALVVIGVIGTAYWFSIDRGPQNVYYGTVYGESMDISTAVAGYIESVDISAGEIVNSGDVIAQINSEEAQLRSDQATAAALASSEQGVKANGPARAEEIAMQKSSISALIAQKSAASEALKKAQLLKGQAANTAKSLKATLALKLDALEKAKSLNSSGSETQKTLDLASLEAVSATANYDNALLQQRVIDTDIASLKAQLTSSDASIASAKSRLAMLEAGQDVHDQAAALASADVAKADANIAALSLSRHAVSVRGDAPKGYLVESVNYVKGEFVGAGAPIATLIDTAIKKVNFYVPEGTLSHIAVGDPLTLTLTTDPTFEVNGKIIHISQEPMFTPMNVVTTTERQRLVFEVQVAIEVPSAGAGAGAHTDQLLPGMLLKVQMGTASTSESGDSDGPRR